MLIEYINFGYDDFLLVCKVEGQEVFRSENQMCNINKELDRMVDRVKPWFMVHGFVLGSVYDSVP